MPPRTWARRGSSWSRPAIQPDNPELLAARARRLPVVRRADMLAELMRLKRSIAVGGTHGKTTTTAMMAALLDAAELDPTVVNGGIINAYGTNARLGQGEWIVVEADESDGSFLRLPATVAVVTNIDPEHMEHYGSFDALRDAFHAFVERVPFYGFAALCIDHPEVQALYGRVTDRRVVTYGFSPQADVRALPPVGRGRRRGVRRRHPRQERRGRAAAGAGAAVAARGCTTSPNALAAIAVARELGIPDEVVRRTLSGLEGVKRRFTRTGTVDGVGIIDDYGHHPVEIKAVLRTARARTDGPGDRRRAAASLHAASPACSTSSAPASTTPTRCWWRRSTPPASRRSRASSRDALVEGVRRRGHRDVRADRRAGRSGAADRGARPAGRSRRLPGRRQHHPVGQRAARAGWRRWRRGRARHERLARDACPPSAAACAATCRWRR